MNELTLELLKRADKLQQNIDEKTKEISLSAVLKGQNGINDYSVIFNMQEIINQRLQWGNYRRACRYLIVAEVLLKRLESERQKITERITELMMEE